jgi:signal transduction histidine kinase
MQNGEVSTETPVDFRQLAPVFHTVRGFTVASTAAVVAVFGTAWDPRIVWALVVLAAITVADALRRRRAPESSPRLILLVEAVVIAVTVLLIGGPALVAAPVAYFLAAALLVLPLRRALLVVAFFTACVAGVYVASIPTGDSSASFAVGIATVLVFLGALGVLLVAALRVNAQMRVREHQLLEEARAANLAKSEMLTRVSHELRTPLSAVVGYAYVLRDSADSLTETDRTEAIRSIAEQSADLSGLIDDLLVSARYELGELTIREVSTNLRAQTSQVLEAWYESSPIDVVGEAPRAMADPARVRQILRNLISNAHRYGGSRVKVVLRGDGDIAGVQVRDNGEGIPLELRDRVFGAFYRVPKDQVHPSSIGLGLAVSRDLARLMGGDLSYRYEDGESIFELQLPAAEPDESQAAKDKDLTAQGSH